MSKIWVEIEHIVKWIMILLDSNDDDSRTKKEIPVLLSAINNAPKYKDPYKSCMPKNKVWTQGTSNLFIKSLLVASKNPDTRNLSIT